MAAIARRAASVLIGAVLIMAAGSVPAMTAGPVPLKIALVRGNTAQARQDPASGAYRGPAIDVATEIGRRLGRSLEIVQLSPAEILAQIADRRIDLGFVAPNPERMRTVAYSKPYLLVQQSAFVVADGPITSVRDLDRAGQVVGANKGDSIAVFLRGTLRNARLLESSDMSMREAVGWVREGRVVGFAGNRQRLGAAIAGQADLRLLPDSLHDVQQAVAVAKTRPALLAETDRVIAQMKRSGALARAVAQSGMAGIAAAPPQ